MVDHQIRGTSIQVDGKPVTLRKAIGLRTVESFNDIVYISTKYGMCEMRRGEALYIAHIAGRPVLTAGADEPLKQKKMTVRQTFLAIFGTATLATMIVWLSQATQIWAGQ
jgi:hypothetical protein